MQEWICESVTAILLEVAEMRSTSGMVFAFISENCYFAVSAGVVCTNTACLTACQSLHGVDWGAPYLLVACSAVTESKRYYVHKLWNPGSTYGR